MGYVSKQMKWVQRELGNFVTFCRSSNDVPMLVFTVDGVQRSLSWFGSTRIMRMFTPYPSLGADVERRDFTPNEFVNWFREANGLDRFNQTAADREAYKQSHVEQAWQRMSTVAKLAQTQQDRSQAMIKRNAEHGTPFLRVEDNMLIDARFGATFPIHQFQATNSTEPPLVYVLAFGEAYEVDLLLKYDDWVAEAAI